MPRKKPFKCSVQYAVSLSSSDDEAATSLAPSTRTCKHRDSPQLDPSTQEGLTSPARPSPHHCTVFLRPRLPPAVDASEDETVALVPCSLHKPRGQSPNLQSNSHMSDKSVTNVNAPSSSHPASSTEEVFQSQFVQSNCIPSGRTVVNYPMFDVARPHTDPVDCLTLSYGTTRDEDKHMLKDYVRMDALPESSWVDVQNLIRGRPPLTQMRSKTGLSPDVYHWITSHPSCQHLVATTLQKMSQDYGRQTIIVHERDGKHTSVAIAECLAATLRQLCMHTRTIHCGLLSRPAEFHKHLCNSGHMPPMDNTRQSV